VLKDFIFFLFDAPLVYLVLDLAVGEYFKNELE
jgi:hypothetical protein